MVLCVCFKSKPQTWKKKKGPVASGILRPVLSIFLSCFLMWYWNNSCLFNLTSFHRMKLPKNFKSKQSAYKKWSGAYKQAQQQEVLFSSGPNFRLWIRPIEMIWEGCGNWDSSADKLTQWSEKEMLLSMTLLLPLTSPHKSPLSDTGLGLKHPIQSHPRNLPSSHFLSAQQPSPV